MPRSLTRISLALLLLLSSELWALGLGDVRLESALNEPLRAEIELLSASPEELANLKVALASAETFDRYGIDRPFYLQDISFELIRTGRADGNYIRVRSASPMSEPFLTFLVEVSWSRGRLLREYTVLLDPPTFAPPSAAQPAPQVTAPQRAAPADSGRIDRAPTPAPVQTRPAPSADAMDPKPQPIADNTPYDTTASGDYVVRRGETLWGIANSMRPDSRLSMNQTMLAIYEANPQAFGGNINLLLEGARIRVPSADEIYRIDRRDALSEVQRQNSSWGISPVATTTTDDADSRPSLTLVPPDEEPVGVDTGVDTGIDTDVYGEPMTREQEVLDRIAEIEAADVPPQESLIEIRNNELAALRQELANIRGEVYEPIDDIYGSDDPFLDDADDEAGDEMEDGELFPDYDEIMADDGTDDAAADDAQDDAADDATTADTPVSTRRRPEPSFIDKAMEWLTSSWAFIGGALIIVIGVLFWFMRRGGDDDEPEAWGTALDADDIGGDTLSGTESMRAPSPSDESMIVVEQDSAMMPGGDTMEVESQPGVGQADDGEFGSLEDTFSSDTAINLDQSDPIAEADFHMAYGLYDQAADLINGALDVEPERQDLLTKLCEIYFVWGNRDAFIDAAERLQRVTGGASGDWDKIVIMGQQIAGDHALFAGAGVVGATKEVDLSFESEADDTGALDMDFGADSGGADVIDLGAAEDSADDGVDFLFDDSSAETTAATGTFEGAFDETIDVNATGEMPTIEQPAVEPTVEMPSPDSTVETPTIEEQFSGFDGTADLPSIPDALDEAIDSSGLASDATAEINLDDLGLDLDGLDETEVASFDDDDELTELASMDDLDSTGTNEALADPSAVTGKNPRVDPNSTGVQQALDSGSTGFSGVLDLEDELSETSEMRLASDETGQNPMADVMDAMDSNVDQSLLDATGRTQVLSDDMAVDTITPADEIGDNDATQMASPLGDDDDFDFAKTEALPPDTYSQDPDATGELPAIGGTDVDLDLDDLTAALKVSDLGSDTIEQMRDDATVEQPRPGMGDDAGAVTQELSADDMSDDLHEARTMTEVGTKLDLARAYVDMGDPAGARSILEEVLDEGDESQRQQAQQLLDSLPS